jgi:hypothetical protein
MCSYAMMRSSAAAALSCSSLGDIGLRRMQAVSNPAQLSAATPSISYGNQRSAVVTAASYKLRLQRPADISRQSFQAACRMRQRRRTDCRMQPAALDMQKRELLVGDVVCLLCFCFYKQVRLEAWKASALSLGCVHRSDELQGACMQLLLPVRRSYTVTTAALFATDCSHHVGASIPGCACPAALQPGAV